MGTNELAQLFMPICFVGVVICFLCILRTARKKKLTDYDLTIILPDLKETFTSKYNMCRILLWPFFIGANLLFF